MTVTCYLAHMDGRRFAPGGQRLDLDEALKRGEFEMYFQPKLNLRSGRWLAPKRWCAGGCRGRVVPPDEFLPAIEANPRHSFAVVVHAQRGAARSGRMVPRRPDFTIAVNLSPANLEDPDLAELVDDAMGVWGFPASQLLLEITETALMRGKADLETALERLHSLGVRPGHR